VWGVGRLSIDRAFNKSAIYARAKYSQNSVQLIMSTYLVFPSSLTPHPSTLLMAYQTGLKAGFCADT
jgi:hypothetical protein